MYQLTSMWRLYFGGRMYFVRGRARNSTRGGNISSRGEEIFLPR